MAYDKIITLHGRMDHCIDYVLNEEKTGLAAALAYAENPAKAHQLVTGINCDPDTALSDMRSTKRRWDKKGGVLGISHYPFLRPRRGNAGRGPRRRGGICPPSAGGQVRGCCSDPC